MHKKNVAKVFCFWDNSISIGCVKLSVLRREYLPSASMCWKRVLRICMSLTETFCKSIALTVINKYRKGAAMQISTMIGRVKKQSSDFACHLLRLFASQLHSQWSINMVKELSLTFQRCLGAFTMLLFEGSLEMGLFRHWTNQVFRGPELRKYRRYESHPVFWKLSKFEFDFKNGAKNSEKFFCFLYTCIWIGRLKLSLLTKVYLPSALSVLGNSLAILHITNRDFL